MRRRNRPRGRSIWFWLACGSGALILALAAAAIIANVAISNFLRGESFRQTVSAFTSRALSAQGEYDTIRWTGPSAYAGTFTARGADYSNVEAIEARDIRTDLDWRALFSGAWRLDRTEVARLDLTLRPPSPKATEPLTPDAGGNLPGWLPRRFEFGEMVFHEANVSLTEKTLPLRLKGSRIALSPEGSALGFAVTGGTLEIPGPREFRVDSMRARLHRGSFFLTSARLLSPPQGTIEASGEVEADAGDYSLRLQGKGIGTATILPKSWAEHLDGTLSGDATLSGENDGSVSATGSFAIADATLRGIPALEEIANFTRSPSFRIMPVQTISGHFSWRAGELRVDSFVLESKGLLRVEGTFAVAADRSLAGQLRVGLTPQTLQWLPGSQERVFTQAANGYLWTGVKISGTPEQPKEDLSARLIAAMGRKVIEDGIDVIGGAAGPAADPIKETAKGLLDTFLPTKP